MSKGMKFPIRLKILIALLFVVTAVVSAITFTMANLFHEDKTAYIRDLASLAARSTAEESESTLVGYGERLRAYARIITDRGLKEEQKKELLKGFFADFPTLVAVTVHEGEREVASAYDHEALAAAGLDPDDLERHRKQHPLPMERIRSGEVRVENTTLTAKLPAMSLALSWSPREGAAPMVVSSLIRLDQLLQLARRTRVFEVSLADSAGVLIMHPDASRIAARERATHPPGSEAVHERHSASRAFEFDENGVAMIGGFAPVGYGRLIAAARIPQSAAYLASRSLLTRLLWVGLGLLFLAALVAQSWSRRITRPVERLSRASREIGQGKFDIQVRVESGDEIGTLASSFNQMAAELNAREKALEDAQAQLIQSEKLAAFGQLGAGIAHEVKNPLAGILGCAQLSLMKLDESSPLHKNLTLIEKETRRCKGIIENLLKFARQEKAAMAPVDVNRLVEDTAALVNHQLELQQIKVRRELSPDLPRIRGNSNQLQQVLMNLLINAQHAMEGNPGSVTLTTRRLGSEHVEIRVSDTGPGIPKEIQRRIFEPFFTTKPTGKGTGLGLSVSFGIVKDHGGEIRPESEPGAGATFVITLPVPTEASREKPAPGSGSVPVAEPAHTA
jgi:signal transduction histidine kinase